MADKTMTAYLKGAFDPDELANGNIKDILADIGFDTADDKLTDEELGKESTELAEWSIKCSQMMMLNHVETEGLKALDPERIIMLMASVLLTGACYGIKAQRDLEAERTGEADASEA